MTQSNNMKNYYVSLGVASAVGIMGGVAVSLSAVNLMSEMQNSLFCKQQSTPNVIMMERPGLRWAYRHMSVDKDCVVVERLQTLKTVTTANNQRSHESPSPA
jgi:hypothetical protein